MDLALRALADPRRRHILRLTRGRELAAGQIAAHFRVSRPAISQHLRVLKDAGLIAERREATRRYYRAQETEVERLLVELGAFWDDRLDSLKREVEHEQRRRTNKEA